MRLIITGGAGFIGSNLIQYWIKKHSEDIILNVDKLTYAADLKNLDEVKGCPRYCFEKIDLVNKDQVEKVVRQFKPEGVIHLAAESHVDNSIKGPEAFIFSNIVGTFNILEACRQLWSSERDSISDGRFHHVSTDEVYGTLGSAGYFTEDTPYAPNSPYSASKASSDHLVRSYNRTYGMNTIITNCSNNFGPHQHHEKLIPTIIKNAVTHKPIPVYGKGENIREWLYVEEHCKAIDLVFHKGKAGESYNIGSHNEWKNIDLVSKICDILNDVNASAPNGDYKKLITYVTDRPGHDFRYALDTGKLENELGWECNRSFDEDLKKTILWYLERFK